MTNLILASAILAASLSAEPAKPAAPEAPKPTATTDAMPKSEAAAGASAEAKKDAPKAPGRQKEPASAEAIQDAVGALLGPCSPEMAGGRVTAVEVLDGKQVNAIRAKEKSKKPKAEPDQRFIKVRYEAGGQKGTSIRQISTKYMLTTEQAQKLVGEKLCVFQE